MFLLAYSVNIHQGKALYAATINIEIAKILLSEYNANPNDSNVHKLLNMVFNKYLEKLPWMQMLLDYGVNYNDCNQSSCLAHDIPIIAMVLSKQPKTVKLLINAGTDMDTQWSPYRCGTKNKHSKTALMFAVDYDEVTHQYGGDVLLNIAQLLIEHSANANTKDNTSKSVLSCVSVANTLLKQLLIQHSAKE